MNNTTDGTWRAISAYPSGAPDKIPSWGLCYLDFSFLSRVLSTSICLFLFSYGIFCYFLCTHFTVPLVSFVPLEINHTSFRIYVILDILTYILSNAFNHTIFVLVPQKVFIQLATVLVKYGLMILLAMDMNTHWQTAYIQHGVNIIVVM